MPKGRTKTDEEARYENAEQLVEKGTPPLEHSREFFLCPAQAQSSFKVPVVKALSIACDDIAGHLR